MASCRAWRTAASRVLRAEIAAVVSASPGSCCARYHGRSSSEPALAVTNSHQVARKSSYAFAHNDADLARREAALATLVATCITTRSEP